jgi:prepilin-type N-terminal cleavage/methylation domain-containing protein
MRDTARASSGFSLIELMIALAIISILASVAIPKFADSVRKAQEASTKGALASMKGALTLYYGDNEGNPPNCVAGPASTVFAGTVVPKYIETLPNVNNGLHPPTNLVYCDENITAGVVHDAQGWYYDGVQPTDAGYGQIWVACDHTDALGNSWTQY